MRATVARCMKMGPLSILGTAETTGMRTRCMLIGELANQSGFSRDTIRYYERIGVFRAPRRRRLDNNYRDYSAADLERLQWIRMLKDHGFSLSEIRDLLPQLIEARDCAGLPDVLEGKLASLNDRIDELHAYRRRVRSALTRCRGEDCEGLPADPQGSG